jgi:hypothetical protein
MTHGVIMTVAGSVSAYDQIHAAALMLTGGMLDGLLLHIGRETKDGFQITEVWESKEQCERCNHEIVWPLVAEVFAHTPAEPVIEEFDPRGLILAGTRIAR